MRITSKTAMIKDRFTMCNGPCSAGASPEGSRSLRVLLEQRRLECFKIYDAGPWPLSRAPDGVDKGGEVFACLEVAQ